MNELMVKYNSLDSLLQHQVIDFVDYLISTRNIVKKNNLSSYKQKILQVSVWSEQDIEDLDSNKKHFQRIEGLEVI